MRKVFFGALLLLSGCNDKIDFEYVDDNLLEELLEEVIEDRLQIESIDLTPESDESEQTNIPMLPLDYRAWKEENADLLEGIID